MQQQQSVYAYTRGDVTGNDIAGRDAVTVNQVSVMAHSLTLLPRLVFESLKILWVVWYLVCRVLYVQYTYIFRWPKIMNFHHGTF